MPRVKYYTNIVVEDEKWKNLLDLQDAYVSSQTDTPACTELGETKFVSEWVCLNEPGR